MNPVSDELLTAYADGELDPITRQEIERLMADDPAIARIVDRHRRLRERLQLAHRNVLEEPVPDRFKAILAPASASVSAPAATRRSLLRWPATDRTSGRSMSVRGWGMLAASLLLGIVVGLIVPRDLDQPYEPVATGLAARGALDRALTEQLAADAARSGIEVGFSFVDHDGAYCRTFQIREQTPIAGLACRENASWSLKVLAPAAADKGELRTAAAMPLAVLKTADALIAGEALGSDAEARARAAFWERERSR